MLLCVHLLERDLACLCFCISGAFDDLEVDYNANQGHVMLDWGRLQLLLLVPWLAALPHVLQGISGGASRQELVLSAAGIVGATSVGLVGLLGAVVWGMDHVIGGKVRPAVGCAPSPSGLDHPKGQLDTHPKPGTP